METAFLKNINDNQGIIHKVCRMYGTDPEDSEDLFQEIVFQLWKSYPQFKGESKVSTWMYRIALNTAITRLQKVRRRPDNQRMDHHGLNLKEESHDRLDIEFSHDLQTAIDTLNKVDKALVMLYLDEKSYKEMAEIIGITESHIGVKINRIKSKLRQILKP